MLAHELKSQWHYLHGVRLTEVKSLMNHTEANEPDP
jgi:hypothetical protein